MNGARKVLVPLSILGLAGMATTLVVDGYQRFFVNWVIWFLFLLTIGLGALFIVALEHLAGSLWSVPIRRVPERLSWMLVWVLPLAVVALFSLSYVYPWTRPEAAEVPMIAGKLGWLNRPFVAARLIVSLALWFFSWRLFVVGSLRQDRTRDPEFTLRARRYAPAFMIVFAFTLTNLAFDWVSSLEPLWYSDMFGVYVFAGTFLAGLAVTALGLAHLRRRGRLGEVRTDHVYNLGGYLFAFTVFWSYIAFAQYMLQWYANMPEEVFWFADRTHGFWLGWAITLGVVHFFIPFFALVSRRAKGDATVLARVAWVVLVAHFLDLFWLVFPSMGGGVLPSWQEASFALFFVPAGLLVMSRALVRGEDLPVGDPRLQAGLEFHLPAG